MATDECFPESSSPPPLVKRRYRRSDDVNKPRIHIQADMQRLEKNMNAIKLIPPKRRAYHPFVFNDMKPYRDVSTAEFLVYLPEMCSKSYFTRQLATDLCDPWVDLEMDRTLLPKIPSTGHLVAQAKLKKKKRLISQDRPPKEGSTMLPTFPVVAVLPDDVQNMTLQYSDLPKLRRLLKRFKQTDDERKLAADYQRTVQDFYRMELDRFDMMKPGNRNRIHLTYNAYFQNTPGSRKAIRECISQTRQKYKMPLKPIPEVTS